jgi:hypothetical protein
MRVSVYQPQYLPRLHYVNRVLDSEVFVCLASAQFTPAMKHRLPDGGSDRRKTYQAHTPIKQPEGEHLLTVPVRKPGSGAAIAEVEPDGQQPWRRRHRKAIEAAYGRAPHLDDHLDGLSAVLERPHDSLADLNLATLLWALDVLLELGLDEQDRSLAAFNERLNGHRGTRLRRIALDAELNVERPPGRQQGSLWLARLCEALGADEYLYGGVATDYMDPDHFAARGIALVQQRWQLRPYPQRFEERVGFIPNLSVLDLLCNVTPERAREIVAPPRLGSSTGSAARMSG